MWTLVGIPCCLSWIACGSVAKAQICIISSIAGLGMKNVNPIYTSTKMATYAFGECGWFE